MDVIEEWSESLLHIQTICRLITYPPRWQNLLRRSSRWYPACKAPCPGCSAPCTGRSPECMQDNSSHLSKRRIAISSHWHQTSISLHTHTHTDDALCPNLIACNNIFTMSNMQHEALQTSQQMSDDIAVLCGGIDPCRPPTESAFLTSMSMTLWTLNMSSQLPRNCIQFSVS